MEASLSERQGYRALDWLVRVAAPEFLFGAHLTTETLLLRYRPEIRSLRGAEQAADALARAEQAAENAWDALLRAGAARGSADFDVADAALAQAGVTAVSAAVRAGAGEYAWLCAGHMAWSVAFITARIMAVRAASGLRGAQWRDVASVALTPVTDLLSEQAQHLLQSR